MNCPGMNHDLLVEWAAGRLSPAEKAIIERHLGECAPCREAAEAQRAVWNALDQWQPAPVSDNFDQRLYARIAAAEAESAWDRFWRGLAQAFSWKIAFSLAGACAVLLAIMLLRAPLTIPGPSTVSAQKAIDIDQVESALDDVDMLEQLGTAVPVQSHQKPDSGS